MLGQVDGTEMDIGICRTGLAVHKDEVASSAKRIIATREDRWKIGRGKSIIRKRMEASVFVEKTPCSCSTLNVQDFDVLPKQ